MEYALRDMSKPMGVAQYRLTQALPEQLQSELPTTEDLAAELPFLDLLTLRIQLERKLAKLGKDNGTAGATQLRNRKGYFDEIE